jgi:DNA-binding Xre family transcriptional regulator
MAMFLHFTVVVSRLSEQNKTLAQEIGLMREELQTLRQSAGASS